MSLPITQNLAAWYQFNKGITSAAGLVSQWNDQSGNARHLIQATGTNQPALQADGSILFDGVDNFMKAAAFTLNQPFTLYMLFRQVTWTSASRLVDGDTANSTLLWNTVASPNLTLFAGASANENTDLPINTYGVVACVFNGASSLLQINNNAATTGNPLTNNAGGFTIGIAGDGVTGPANIQVKEVAIYAESHNLGQRTSLVNYLLEVNAGGSQNWQVFRSMRGRR